MRLINSYLFFHTNISGKGLIARNTQMKKLIRVVVLQFWTLRDLKICRGFDVDKVRIKD